MAGESCGTTFRIRQIPAYLKCDDLSRLLHRVLRYPGHPKGIRIHSLATSAISFEGLSLKVATATFEQWPSSLVKGRKDWTVSSEVTGLSHNILFDTHFLGFTVLNDIAPDQAPVEYRHPSGCIALSGLASHPFGSWRDRDSQDNFMWLRDLLPRRFRGMRVIIYGYDTRLVQSQSFQDINDIATCFIHELQIIGSTSPSAPSLVFLAHSLGGIVLKEAFTEMARGNEAVEKSLMKIKGVVFFGVPNKGMMISHLIDMVHDQPNKALVQSLSRKSDYLERLDEQFCGIAVARGIFLASIYETTRSQIPEQNSDGEWKRTGPFEVLVEKNSAVQSGSTSVLPVNKDHSNLVKFAEGESGLEAVCQIIKSIVKQNDASRMVPSRPREASSTIPESNAASVSLLRRARQALKGNARLGVQKLLRSLLINEATDRYDEIIDAHKSTFTWLLDSDAVGLSDWIQHGQGIFWISGKPGSGKSTAMRYLWENLVVKKTPDPGEIRAKFFFHYRGSPLQKSLEGLFRGIIYQILDQAKNLAEKLVTERRKQNIPLPQQWNIRQLQKLWSEILGQQKFDLRLTLFLDALDEFDGPPEEAADFVRLATTAFSDGRKTRVRICLASRPLATFRDSFARCEGLRMQDHTRDDMRTYVYSQANTHPRMKHLLELSNNSQRAEMVALLEQLLEQADGVFLWIRLVLERLLRQWTRGESIAKLREALLSLPTSLEALYATVLNRVEERHYLQEAYIMLEILARSEGPVPVKKFSCIIACASQPLAVCVETVNSMTHFLIGTELENLKRKIMSRCGGLIETLWRSDRNSKESMHVQLMHQSVREFVLGPNFRPIFWPDGDITTATENGHTYLAKYVLAVVWAQASGVPRVKLADTELDALRLAELSTGLAQRPLLETIPAHAFSEFFIRNNVYYRGNEQYVYVKFHIISPRLCFAILADLHLSVGEMLSNMLKRQKHLRITVPLLNLIAASYDGQLRRFCRILHDHAAMAELLLDHGVPVDTKFDGLTALQLCIQSPRTKILQSLDVESETMLDKIILLLLNRGGTAEREFVDGAWIRCTPLHITRSKAVMQCLLEHGADPNALDVLRRTPLDALTLSPGDTRDPEHCCDCLELLLSYGGGFTFNVLKCARWTLPGSVQQTLVLNEIRHRLLDHANSIDEEAVQLLQEHIGSAPLILDADLPNVHAVQVSNKFLLERKGWKLRDKVDVAKGPLARHLQDFHNSRPGTWPSYLDPKASNNQDEEDEPDSDSELSDISDDTGSMNGAPC